MLKDYEASEKGSLYDFLQTRFCRVSANTASKFCTAIGATSRTRAGDVEPQQVEKLFKVFDDERLAPPPTDCLAPIGVRQLLAGLLKGVKAEFYAASTREAAVYRGRPFQIEAAIAFGGDLPGDQAARVIRFANRVPLLFQQSACSSFKAVEETPWKNYAMQQPRGSGSGNARGQRMGALCQYVAGINARGNPVDADAGRPRPFLQGPKGRDRAAMAWQQRGMDIHPTQRRQSEHFQRENLIEMKG
jgi:hypothetical protein